jgi:hypothetical protein
MNTQELIDTARVIVGANTVPPWKRARQLSRNLQKLWRSKDRRSTRYETN